MWYNGGMDVEVNDALARSAGVSGTATNGTRMAMCETPAIDDLLVAARELKMPLATLRQLALSLSGVGDERVCAEMVGVSERAMRQVNDLLRLEKLNSGLFEMEPVAIRAACAEACETVAQMPMACEVVVEYRNRLPLVTANRELLTSVVYNLLINAAGAAHDLVRLVARDTRGGVEIAVRDRGPVATAMRPGVLATLTATRFAQYMHGEMTVRRHRDGMSYLLWLPRSQQRSLW